jgi:hypothetical protein
VAAIGGIDQLCGDAQTIGGAPQAAFQHQGRAQLPRDLADVGVRAFERKRGPARHHTHARQLGKGIDDLFGQPIGEILIILVAARRQEWQHGHARLLGHFAGGGGRSRFHGSNKLIAAARHGGDVAVIAVAFAQETSKGRDVLSKVVLFHGGTGPQGSQQLFLIEHGPAVLYQVGQGVISLRCEKEGVPSRRSRRRLAASRR